MEKRRGVAAFAIAVLGTVLVALPIVAPLVLAFGSLVATGEFRLDYLMPAELFFLVVGGGVPLFAVAVWAKRLRLPIGIFLGTAIASFFGCVFAAQVTGLANGPTRPGGWEEAVVMAMLALYAAAVLTLCVAGALLCGGLRAPRSKAAV